MAGKATFTTTIDKDTQNKFKSRCAKQGVKMNDVLTVFMNMYAAGEFRLILELDGEDATIVKNK